MGDSCFVGKVEAAKSLCSSNVVVGCGSKVEAVNSCFVVKYSRG